jgi:AcrR family transcriptional regulator
MPARTVRRPAKRNALPPATGAQAAIAEFTQYGFDGARTDRVAKRAPPISA